MTGFAGEQQAARLYICIAAGFLKCAANGSLCHGNGFDCVLEPSWRFSATQRDFLIAEEVHVEFVDGNLFPAMWVGWVLYWLVSSRNVKATARRESLSSRLSHVVPLLLAVVLLWARRLPLPILDERFIAQAAWPFWAGAALTATGLLFTVWALACIWATNWSGTVTIKQGHELIMTGPYAVVRHPIYTGLLLAFVGSALARAEFRGILAVALAFWSLWRKLRIEESWMREQFGEAYQAYSRRVAALVPFIL